jgi:surface antigen
MKPSRAVLSVAIAALASGLAATSRAADVCGETVPTNRFIDGLPAYAQCAGSMTGAIYSNNGIDTSTTSGGAGWVRTQGSGGYQCTELAHRYLTFRWDIPSVPNGNAGVWCDAALPSGLVKATTPVHGDLIVFAPGSCGADATTGHVAVIDVVNADSSVMAVQQNVASRSRYNLSCAACILHVAANTGAPSDGGVPGADAGGAAGTSGAGGVSGTGTGAGGAGGRGGAGGATGIAGATGAGGTAPTPDGAAGTTGGGPGGTAGTAGTTGGSPGASPDGASGGCAYGGRNPGEGLVPFSLFVLIAFATPRRRRQ